MEPEGSFPHSQVPANCPYPEPDQSSPYPQIPHMPRICITTNNSLSTHSPCPNFSSVKFQDVFASIRSQWTKPETMNCAA